MIEPLIIESPRVRLAQEPMEIVERKGLGHPDTICDAVMESVAVELAQASLKRCGRVLHFNADKGMLVAGQRRGRTGEESRGPCREDVYRPGPGVGGGHP
ncbi:MAG: hypothetical protein IPM58_08185 [Nitrospira sp.]|nr:hypothetical protein [Nitrospira sp.]